MDVATAHPASQACQTPPVAEMVKLAMPVAVGKTASQACAFRAAEVEKIAVREVAASRDSSAGGEPASPYSSSLGLGETRLLNPVEIGRLVEIVKNDFCQAPFY